MPGKATGLSTNAFLLFAYNNHQSGKVRKWHNIELKIFLGKLLICLTSMIVLSPSRQIFTRPVHFTHKTFKTKHNKTKISQNLIN